MTLKDKTVLISGAMVYRRPKGKKDKPLWFAVKQNHDSDWEIPKTTVRRGESSVRSVIRIMAEQGGMRARVLEEVGRSAGSTTVNKRIVPQRHIYYLMLAKGDDNILGFADFEWLPYEKISKRLTFKKDIAMLKNARDLLKQLDREKAKNK